MSTNTGRLAGKVAIITGASKGTGAVMGKQFADAGAKVLMVARNEEAVVESAAAAGNGAIGMRADVTNEADVAAMVDRAMTEWGQVDILLNNAVIPGKDLHVWEQTLENWNDVFAICITAPMIASREVLNRSMLARKTGSIVNFSSTAGWTGMPRKSHYVSSKAGLRALTKVIATEAGPFGVRCNCPAVSKPISGSTGASACRLNRASRLKRGKRKCWAMCRCARFRSRRISATLPFSSPATTAAPSPASRSIATPAAS